MKKIALCFMISYDHSLNKEEIWKEWISYNKDIINVYFHYKNYRKITSPWIKEHSIPPHKIASTSYFHVVPAYISLMSYAYSVDINNQWFCFLTDSCVPIISPVIFRKMFMENYQKSIIKCSNAYWNVEFHKRANLASLPKDYHLANDPWFTLSREHVERTIQFMFVKNDIYKKICGGTIANESLFAIVLKVYGFLYGDNHINQSINICDWSHMSSATSPYIFNGGNSHEIDMIFGLLKHNKYAVFLRKVSREFPDEVLHNIIYDNNKVILKIQQDQNNKAIMIYFIIFIYVVSIIGLMNL